MQLDNRAEHPFEFVEGECTEVVPLRHPRWLRTCIGAVIFVLGLICLGLTHDNSNSPDQKAQPVRTVTVTVTVTKRVVDENPVALPETCTQAIQLVRAMQAEFSQLSNIGNIQADILSDMMVAILAKDTAKMQAAGTAQKNLDNSQSENNRKLRDDYVQLGELLDQCTVALG